MNRLRQLREERNMTQEELAFELDTSQQRISKIECGLSMMNEKMIRDFARYFGVTTDYFLGISDVQIEIAVFPSGSRKLPDDYFRDILYYYTSFDVEEKSFLKDMAERIVKYVHDRDNKQKEAANDRLRITGWRH